MAFSNTETEGMGGSSSENISVIGRIDEVLTLSRDVLQAIEAENIPALSQLLMQRGNLIDVLKKQQLLPQDRANHKLQEALKQKMDAITAMEPEIQNGLKRLSQQFETQLKNLNEQKVVNRHYKHANEGKSTRSNLV